ncbi:hypothetical protein BH23ACT9_BH23ACT9_01800 [soil metagenome]
MTNYDVLERILDGTAAPAEEMTDELREMARLADLLASTAASTAPPAVMSAAARNELRNALVREANTRAALPPPLLTRLRERMTSRVEGFAYSARLAGVSGVAVAVLSTGGVSVATEASLPGDALYGLKLAAEDVRLRFSTVGLPRAEGLLGQILNRLEEAERALDRGSEAVAANALDRADTLLRTAAQQHLVVYLETGDTAILTGLDAWVAAASQRIDGFAVPSAEAVQPLTNLRTTIQRISQRIEVLLTGACTTCAAGVHDAADPPATQARGTEADGTPPVPPAAFDITAIPPADQPFSACPCVPRAAPPAVPRPESASGTSPTATDPHAADGPPPATGSPSAPPGGGGSPDGGGGGGLPAPPPLPVPEQPPLPDPPPSLPPLPGPLEGIMEQVPTSGVTAPEL